MNIRPVHHWVMTLGSQGAKAHRRRPWGLAPTRTPSVGFRPTSLLPNAPQLLVRADEKLAIRHSNRRIGMFAEPVGREEFVFRLGCEHECLAAAADHIEP